MEARLDGGHGRFCIQRLDVAFTTAHWRGCRVGNLSRHLHTFPFARAILARGAGLWKMRRLCAGLKAQRVLCPNTLSLEWVGVFVRQLPVLSRDITGATCYHCVSKRNDATLPLPLAWGMPTC